jgi:hypothetical protein
MQWSTDIRQIKAAIWNQAFIGRTSVSCPMGRVVAIRRRKGRLQAMIFGWGRWYNVEGVLIVAGAPPALTQPACLSVNERLELVNEKLCGKASGASWHGWDA